MVVKIIIMCVFILFSAYFSATETAFSSLNKTRLKMLAKSGNKKAALTERLAENYDKLISTILIGNNIVNIGAASLGTLIFVDLCGSPDTGATVSTIVVTLAVLVFGEITPKSIAKECPEGFAMFSAPFLNVLIILLTPVTVVFFYWKKFISKLLHLERNDKMSKEELLTLVGEVESEGSINTSEGELLRNAIEFSEQRAEDILTPRVNLEAVSSDASKEKIAEKFSETKFSRILVYDDNIDDIIGVVHQKDFYDDGGVSKLPMSELVRPVIYIPKKEKISSLLRKLQKKQAHIAVVLDEYGGTCGIVTVEDILEELVGEIWDEHDDVVEDFRKIGPRTFRVDCSTELDEFSERFRLGIESDTVSVGGWVAESFGKVPKAGDSFSFKNLDITVEIVDKHRVESIIVVQKAENDGKKAKNTNKK